MLGSPVPTRFAFALFVLHASACASTPRAPARPTAPAAIGARWYGTTLDIAAAPDNDGRRKVIEESLETLGLAFERVPFDAPERRGTNLIVTMPDERHALPLLMIGAHYDRVAVGRGAVDNASGVATVLALGEALKRSRLAGHRVVLAFWDLEESGLLGSKAYVASKGGAVDFYLNFDVFGYGDTLWGMVAAPGTPLGDAMRAAAEAAGMPIVLSAEYPPTDHLAFLAAGRPAASLSLVGGGEIPHILDGFAGRKMQVVPRVLQVIHSAKDVASELEQAPVLRALPVVLDGLRRWDAAAPPRG